MKPSDTQWRMHGSCFIGKVLCEKDNPMGMATQYLWVPIAVDLREVAALKMGAGAEGQMPGTVLLTFDGDIYGTINAAYAVVLPYWLEARGIKFEANGK